LLNTIGPGMKIDWQESLDKHVKGGTEVITAPSVMSDGKIHQNSDVASKSRGVRTDVFIGDSPACSIGD